MDKILHQKLTSRTFFAQTCHGEYKVNEALCTGMVPEMKILEQAAKDLLSPRKEAIDRLLRMSREMNNVN